MLFLAFFSKGVMAVEVNPKLIEWLASKPDDCSVTITSGYRDAKHNKVIGGAKNSYHLTGEAVDFITNCRDFFIFKAKVEKMSIIIYPKHLHIDTRKPPLFIKGSYKTKHKSNI